MTGIATSTMHVENERVRVTEWTFRPGEATGWHRHEYDYVITPVTDGEVGLIGKDGQEHRASMAAGRSYFRAAGVEHDVVNRGTGILRFVETELKG